MPRTVTASFQTELEKTITKTGYMVAFNTTPAIQLCNVGSFTWASKLFIEADVIVSGLSWGDNAQGGSVSIQNLDNTIGAVFMLASIPSILCDIWQVNPNAIGVDDPVKLNTFVITGVDIGLDRVELQLTAQSTLDAFSPRRRIDPYFGFNYAMPDGSKITWENENITIGADRG